MAEIQLTDGLETNLSETQTNALKVLENLSLDEFNQLKEFLDLGQPGVLGPQTLQTFMEKGGAEGFDFSDDGVDQFKAKNDLGNSGVLQGVIGPQTASLMVNQIMGQDHEAPGPDAPRQIKQAGIDLIKEFEGFARLIPGRPGFVEAYLDRVGVATIGYGHTKGVTLGLVISTDQANEDLQEDLASSEASVSRYVTVDITDNQFAALVSFVFNLGAGSLASSTLLRKLNAGDSDGAAAEFSKWVNAGGKPQPGLEKRRAAERELFLTP